MLLSELIDDSTQDIHAFGTAPTQRLARGGNESRNPYAPANSDYAKYYSSEANHDRRIIDSKHPRRVIAKPSFFVSYVRQKKGENRWYVRIEGNRFKERPALPELAQTKDKAILLRGDNLPPNSIVKLPREILCIIGRNAAPVASVFYFVSPDYFRDILVDAFEVIGQQWRLAH